MLVVDDEPAIRRILSDLFASEGYLVSEASDGEQALQQLRLAPPNIVVLDFMMPVMNGLEFVAKCRQIDGCAELPIILVSAMHGATATATWLSGIDVNAFLGKPFDIDEILALVELHARPTITDSTRELQLAMEPPQAPVRVLLVLDNVVMASVAKLTLNHGAYELRNVTSSPAVAATLAFWQPHLVLLDMELEGATIMQQIGVVQPGGARLPVIGLTRRGDLKSKLAAFEAGAQDILTLPFSPEELLARVVAIVRRSYTDTVAFTPVVEVGHFELDILNRTARSGTSEIRLTSLEQSLFYLLAANAGRIVSQKEINALCGADSIDDNASADRQIRNLRARLLTVFTQQEFIATVPGRGYRFLSTEQLSS
jgi:two-component system, OmpR family, response regulator ResD